MGLILASACQPRPAMPVEDLALPAVVGAPSSATLAPLSDPAFRRLESRGGEFVLCWRPVADRVPRNEAFELEVWVYDGERPVRGLQLFVRGWMPDHGHGLLRSPNVVEQADGSYRVQNVLLHMRGHWQLFFDLLRDGHADVAECDLEL